MSLKRKIKRAQQSAPKQSVKPQYTIANGAVTAEQHSYLAGLKVVVGTPMYGGLCHGQYTNSMIQFNQIASQCGIKVFNAFLFNESLIQRGRNNIVHQFLEADADYLLFIDADIGFAAPQALELILAAQISGQRLVGATYSKKSINWPQAVRHMGRGVRVDRLAHVSGDHVINAATDGPTELRIHELFPVKYLGTGFMLIHRSVFDAIRPQTTAYRSDQIAQNYNLCNTCMKSVRNVPHHTYFDCLVCPEEKRYLSEDYLFCKRAIQVGITPQLAPWINLIHFGTIGFEGCYPCTQTADQYVHNVLAVPPSNVAPRCKCGKSLPNQAAPLSRTKNLQHACKCGNVVCNGSSGAI